MADRASSRPVNSIGLRRGCGIFMLLAEGDALGGVSLASTSPRRRRPVKFPVSRQWILCCRPGSSFPGSSYTVTAATPDDEMMLHMLSLGVLTGKRAVPRTYYGAKTGASLAGVEFFVSYECAGEQPRGTPQPLLNGCLWATGARQD